MAPRVRAESAVSTREAAAAAFATWTGPVARALADMGVPQERAGALAALVISREKRLTLRRRRWTIPDRDDEHRSRPDHPRPAPARRPSARPGHRRGPHRRYRRRHRPPAGRLGLGHRLHLLDPL
ncbi:LmrA/YxaF family transcription factor [Streptomyces aurantiogriseus]|uniref:LmrA/YxaF family transcription factor n=1 Tax=Streptomyces aurantiogriseus TaxID=66870 RepID=UPI003570E929